MLSISFWPAPYTFASKQIPIQGQRGAKPLLSLAACPEPSQGPQLEGKEAQTSPGSWLRLILCSDGLRRGTVSISCLQGKNPKATGKVRVRKWSQSLWSGVQVMNAN